VRCAPSTVLTGNRQLADQLLAELRRQSASDLLKLVPDDVDAGAD
jgi:hypothetical protein